VGAELEISTRRVRPAGDRRQSLGPKLARLRADLRHNLRPQSLVGDLLQQILVPQVGKLLPAESRASSSSASAGAAARSRSIRLPPLPGASGRSPSTSTYAETVPSMAAPMAGSNGQAPLPDEHPRAARGHDLARDRLGVQTPEPRPLILGKRRERDRDAASTELVGHKRPGGGTDERAVDEHECRHRRRDHRPLVLRARVPTMGGRHPEAPFSLGSRHWLLGAE
jgi:hypothetical protein